MLLFATSNKHKFQEATQLLDIEIRQLPFEYTEIRSDSLDEVASDAARAAYKRAKEPVFVEDTGLFIDALKGFPGTYSGWVFGKIGMEGVLKLLEGVEDRSAYFQAVVGYMKDKEHVSLFHGKCSGRISLEPRGSGGFGYDPIFVPDGEDQTFAESIQLKNKLSHRYKALLEFSKSLSLRS